MSRRQKPSDENFLTSLTKSIHVHLDHHTVWPPCHIGEVQPLHLGSESQLSWADSLTLLLKPSASSPASSETFTRSGTSHPQHHADISRDLSPVFFFYDCYCQRPQTWWLRTNILSYSSGSQKSKLGFYWTKLKCQQGYVPSGAPGRIHFLPFSNLL